MSARLKAAACCTLMVVTAFIAASAVGRLSPSGASAGPLTADRFFRLDQVRTVELSFAAAQWAAMEPDERGGPFGGRGGPPGGGPPGGPDDGRRAGPSTLLASAALDAGDADGDWQLSRTELATLANSWFDAWDATRGGALTADQLRAGIGTLAGLPDGAPGGPPRGGRGGDVAPVSRNGFFAASGNGFPIVKADLRIDGQAFPDVSVRYKGNNTFMEARGTLKRSLKIDLNDDGYDGRKLAGVSKLNLHNNITDASWMNEVLSYRLFRDAGVPGARTSYARVFVSVPGLHDHRYFGLYSIVENPDNNYARERFGTKKGAIFKPVTRRLFEDAGDTWADYAREYDAKTPVSDEETRRVLDFANLVSHATDEEFDRRLEEFLDLDQFARFMAVTVWLSNMDSILGMAQNYLVYLHPKSHQFQFLPWDLDHSFGQFPMIVSGGGVDLSIDHAWSDVRFLDRVFAVGRFKRLYLQRMREFSETIFKPERLLRQVDDLAPVIRAAVGQESPEKLVRFDQCVAGTVIERAGGLDGPGPRPDSRGGGQAPAAPRATDRGPRGGPPGFGGPVLPIKVFARARAAAVSAQLAGTSPGVALTRGGPGGPPGGGPGRGGPGGFDLATLVARALADALDADRDGRVTKAEFVGGFLRWFDAWDTDGAGQLTRDQLDNLLSEALPLQFGPPRGDDRRRE
jgi:spore coat protein H